MTSDEQNKIMKSCLNEIMEYILETSNTRNAYMMTDLRNISAIVLRNLDKIINFSGNKENNEDVK